MAAITTGLMTFEEFERLPEHVGRRELLEGELIELPPPKKRHNIIAERAYGRFLEAETRIRSRASIGEIHIGMGYLVSRNPDSWLVPDVSLTHPDQPGDEYYEGAPLIAIEVVSPSNTAEQIQTKIRIYLANGSREVWVFFPKTAEVMLHRKGGAVLVTDKLESDLLPGFSLDLRWLFSK